MKTVIKTGSTFIWDIYGHLELVKLLAVHALGTFDVERISDGKCFRCTGLRQWSIATDPEENSRMNGRMISITTT